MLIDKGADVNALDEEMSSALIFAADGGNTSNHLEYRYAVYSISQRSGNTNCIFNLMIQGMKILFGCWLKMVQIQMQSISFIILH